MKKFFSVLLAAVLLISMPLSAYANEPETSVTAEGIYLMSLDTGQVLYEKNPDRRLAPASMTKVMTAIVAMELCEDLDATTITASQGIYNEFAGLNVSTANILYGETYTVRQLLYCMMLQSANEAANIVAEYFGNGSIEAFVDKMNEKAKEIGCQNTHFQNPHGLDAEDHYTTPRDMALMAQYALKIPGFYEIVSSTRYPLEATPKQPARILVTTIKIQDRVNGGSLYNPYVKGIKTGTTDTAGRCFVSTYSREGENYLCVVMNAPNDGLPNKAFVLTNELYDWVWRNFEMKTIIKKDELIHEEKLLYCSDQNTLLLKAGEDFSMLLPVGADSSSIQKSVSIDKSPLEAPLKEGDQVGEVTLKMSSKTVGKVPLLVSTTVERSAFLYAIYQIQLFFSSTPVKIILLIVLILALAYVALVIFSNHSRRNRNSIRTKRPKKTFSKKRNRRF